jgi:hypothetical protein
MIYNVPKLDTSRNNNFGVVSFFKELKDARFKCECGFDPSILSTYAKVKEGSLSLSQYWARLRIEMDDPVHIPSKRLVNSVNYISIPYDQFTGKHVFTFYKSLVIS